MSFEDCFFYVVFHLPPAKQKQKKTDKVATQLKVRGDLIGLGFDWFNFIRDWFLFSIG